MLKPPDTTDRSSFVFVDEGLIFYDKAKDLPSHFLKDEHEDCALTRIAQQYPEVLNVNRESPDRGLCHRLDNGTSGLLVCARNDETHRRVSEYFRNGEAKKEYLAWVSGVLNEDRVIETAIVHHPKNRAKMLALSEKTKYFRGKPRAACTQVHCLRNDGLSTLVLLELVGPGARHQIRVHLASIGHPLLGDTLYGAAASERFPTQALHASALTLPKYPKVSTAPNSNFS